MAQRSENVGGARRPESQFRILRRRRRRTRRRQSSERERRRGGDGLTRTKIPVVSLFFPFSTSNQIELRLTFARISFSFAFSFFFSCLLSSSRLSVSHFVDTKSVENKVVECCVVSAGSDCHSAHYYCYHLLWLIGHQKKTLKKADISLSI